MIDPRPVVLEGFGLRLEPLEPAHEAELESAAADGRLWELVYTSVPEPGAARQYIAEALEGRKAGHMLPWAVRLSASGQIVGSTRYHDIVADVDRVEIGYTWYAASHHGTHVNPACKLLLLRHAFEGLGCGVVGLRTDDTNLRSQGAIEKLGARRDGLIRHSRRRRDGTVGGTVMYSILRTEWPAVERGLAERLARLRGSHHLTLQPVPSVSDEDVQRVVQRDFRPDQRPRAAEVLEGYGGDQRSQSAHRVRLAAMKRAQGDLRKLSDFIDAAREDPRDLIASAEYPNYMDLAGSEITQQRRNAAIDRDWAQYQAWLRAETP
jgi:RimJ/RimL family protein N-acetyltransferase